MIIVNITHYFIHFRAAQCFLHISSWLVKLITIISTEHILFKFIFLIIL